MVTEGAFFVLLKIHFLPCCPVKEIFWRSRGGRKIKSGVINKGVCMSRKARRYVRSPACGGRRRNLLLLVARGNLEKSFPPVYFVNENRF